MTDEDSPRVIRYDVESLHRQLRRAPPIAVGSAVLSGLC